VEAVQGPRARAELTFDELPFLWEGSRFTLGGEAQHDGPRGDQYFATARLRVPLQIYGQPTSKLTPMERRMTDPIVRDIDIVSRSGQFSAPETVTQTASGKTFSVLDSASTTGGNLATALTNAGNNSTVVLSGTFSTGTSLVSLATGQTVMAGTVTVRSPSGRTASFTTSATIAATNATTNSTAVQINSAGTLTGLTITNTLNAGGGGAVVRIADTATGAVVTNNTITMTQSGANGALALAFGTNTGGTVTGNTLSVTGSGGATTMTALAINNGGTFTISGNSMTASGGTTNNMMLLGAAASTVSSGSTGNTRGSGACNGTLASGSVSFTNGTTCP
jgi:hypothetical protein